MSETKSTLSPELLEKARVELNEDQSKVPDQIKSFRNKILEDPSRNFKTDDAFLLRFLRARKFDEGRALELIINYYKQREHYPDLYGKSSEDLERLLKGQLLGALTGRDTEGRAVIFLTCERWDPNDNGVLDHAFGFLLTMEALIEDEAVQINGVSHVFDLIDMNMNHISCFNPFVLKSALSSHWKYFPIRVKGIHFVNESPIFDSVYAVFKPLLSKKLQERVVFHGNSFPSLHDYINPEILPEELGGDLETIDYTEWNDKLRKTYTEFTEHHKKYGFVNSSRTREENEEK